MASLFVQMDASWASAEAVWHIGLAGRSCLGFGQIFWRAGNLHTLVAKYLDSKTEEARPASFYLHVHVDLLVHVCRSTIAEGLAAAFRREI